MIPVAKAADAAQFLSLIPRLLGFTPTQSLVVIPFADRRSLGAIRVDLPPHDPGAAAEAAIATVAGTVIGMVCRLDRASSLAVAVFTDASVADELPHRDLVEAVRTRADASGLDLVDALIVGSDGWASYLDADAPSTPRELTQLHFPPPRADGSRDDQAAGAHIENAPAPLRRKVARSLRALEGAVIALYQDVSFTASPPSPTAMRALEEFDDMPRLFEAIIRSPAANPWEHAMLVWALDRPAVRDVALVQWTRDIVAGQDAVSAQQRWEDGEPYPTDLAATLWGEGPQPDPERLATALDRCREAVSVAPRRMQPGGLAACAWLSWALGRSTHAAVLAEQALAIDPHHGLADIVRSLVAAAHLPAWSFRGR